MIVQNMSFSLHQLSLYDKSVSSLLSFLITSLTVISVLFIGYVSFRCIFDHIFRNVDANQYNLPELMESFNEIPNQ